MSFRHLVVIFSISICVSAKSFTLVLDTTQSMQFEINEIRSRIRPMLRSIANTTTIDNYVIVPFNDPGIGPVNTFTAVDPFLDTVDSIRVSGGLDIPENSLSGLEKALQESKPESDIFLFTDACANDEAKFINIQRLCRVTRSKVIIFMSGRCSYSDTNKYGNMDTYYHVTKVCFGNVFKIDHTSFGQAFRFMKEIVKDDYNDVKVFEKFTGYRELPFSADVLTRDVIVAITGEAPSLQLFEENGHSPRTDMLIESQHLQVVRIVEPHRGRYKAAVSCQGNTSVTIYSRNQFPLEIGFSPLIPNSIAETTSKPLPGRVSFIFVLVPKSYEYELNALTIYLLNEDSKNTVNLVKSKVQARIYIAQAFFKSRSKFRMTINGIDRLSSDSVKITSKTLESQTEVTNAPWSAAVIESVVPESPLTNYKTNTRVSCKVTGCPPPTIWWEDEDEHKMTAEDSLLEYPATYISYVEIQNMTENRTITCKASTATGNDSKEIQLYVYRPYVFRMIRTPEDTTIRYEEGGKLFCEVEAYPDPHITWYYNDIEIKFPTNEIDDEDDNDDETEYLKEYNALIIKKMTSTYVGTYKCDVKNEVNFVSYSVEVRISGLEAPELETSETELTSKLGDTVEILCRVLKGTPTPAVTWKYKPVDGSDFAELPNDIELEGEKIVISAVTSNHKGSYKCEAVNEKGQDAREVALKVIYAPKFDNEETVTKEVLLDKSVILDCSVDAEPEASVKWERSDGAIFPDDRHVVDGYSLKFTARINDSGSYKCIAENEAGSSEKTTIVNVLVPPYITPVVKNMTLRAGSNLRLMCNVQEANPPPTIKWKFTSRDSRSTLLSSDESIFSKEAFLSGITKEQSGTYLCIVENSVGFDLIEIYVNVV